MMRVEVLGGVERRRRWSRDEKMRILAESLAYGKFCLHLPLHRQSRAFAREGVEIDVSTMADWMGAVSVALKPMVEIIEAHVLAAQRLHVDDTPVPVLAKGKAKTGRLWTAVRDDRPFGGVDPPAAIYVYSPDRAGVHPEAFLRTWSGIMQADAYAGFNRLYEPGRTPGAILEAACWAHWRRKFYDLAILRKAPLAMEAVALIDAVFAIEHTINGDRPQERQAVRKQTIRPLVEELDLWLRTRRRRLSSKSDIAKAMDYDLKRWPAFTRFLDDGFICVSNNAAERAVKCVAMGRKNWTFVGSDAGGHRAAAMYTLIETAKLNDVNPRAWIADILHRLPDHPAKRIPRASTVELVSAIRHRSRGLSKTAPASPRSARRPSPDAHAAKGQALFVSACADYIVDWLAGEQLCAFMKERLKPRRWLSEQACLDRAGHVGHAG